MDIEFTREEAEWCVSMLKSNLDLVERLPEEQFTETKVKLWKKILIQSGTFREVDLLNVNTKQEIVDLNRAMIKELEDELLRTSFDPEEDVAVKYLRSIGAREDLIEVTKSRVTPENIKRS